VNSGIFIHCDEIITALNQIWKVNGNLNFWIDWNLGWNFSRKNSAIQWTSIWISAWRLFQANVSGIVLFLLCLRFSPIFLGHCQRRHAQIFPLSPKFEKDAEMEVDSDWFIRHVSHCLWSIVA
jgi:hypothetical protein